MTTKNAHAPSSNERCPWRGVLAALVAPFHEDGRVDFRSLEAQTDFVQESGVDGIVVNAHSGEAGKLNDEERRRIAEVVLKRVGDRRPVIVGASGPSNHVAVEFGRHAKDNGASGLLASPPPGAAFAESQVQIFYDELDAAVGLPVMIQDSPHLVPVPLPPHLVSEIHREVQTAVAVKIEAPPTSTKMGAVARLSPGLAMFGGLDGAYLVDEMERGARGIVCGPAFPGELVQVVSAVRAGDIDGARRLHARTAELIRFLSQSLEFSFHATKRILQKRGILDSSAVRRPTTPFDERNERDLLRIATDAAVLPRTSPASH